MRQLYRRLLYDVLLRPLVLFWRGCQSLQLLRGPGSGAEPAEP